MNNGTTGLILFVSFYLVIAYFYIKSWKQLKNAYKQSNYEWPLASHQEVKIILNKNPIKGYSLMLKSIKEALKIIFFSHHTDLPTRKAVLSIRLVLAAFVGIPLIIMAGLVLAVIFLT